MKGDQIKVEIVTSDPKWIMTYGIRHGRKKRVVVRAIETKRYKGMGGTVMVEFDLKIPQGAKLPTDWPHARGVVPKSWVVVA